MPLCLANYSDPIPPCREVCERVRTPCESFYTRYGFIWPDALKCEQYPSSEENAICMDPNKDSSKSSLRAPSQSCCQCNTSLGYRPIDDDNDHHHQNSYSVPKCHPPCRSPYFADEHSISLINTWLTMLSILCALSCTFVLLTFFLDMRRFKYPQRPIIFLSLCYFFVACGYLIRLLLGHENVACRMDHKVNEQILICKKNFSLVLVSFIGLCTTCTCCWSIELCLCLRTNIFLWYGIFHLVGYINLDMVSRCGFQMVIGSHCTILALLSSHCLVITIVSNGRYSHVKSHRW